jgi:hypothetical protein
MYSGEFQCFGAAETVGHLGLMRSVFLSAEIKEADGS